MHVKESCHYQFLQTVDFYIFRYGDTAIHSKSPFPARIAPFSVFLGRMEAVRKVRFERETWTYFVSLYLHNEEVKINDLQKSIVTGLLYMHIDFEAIWTFLQGAT